MPTISKRGSEIVQSPIRSLVPLARAAKEKGTEIYHLNIGQPDIQTPTSALRKVQNIDERIIAYGSSEGRISLRNTVAKYYKKFNIDINADQIYVTTGASEAIQFALFACFDPGDEIIMPEPFYANYIGYSQLGSVHLVPLTTTLEEGFQLPAIEEFEKVITNKTKAIFLCNPGNPTGQLYNAESLRRLAELVKKHDLYLIVDEVYREFCYEKEFLSVLTFEQLEENVIVLDSISKVFSSCGARVGYIITRNESLLENIVKYAQLRLCPPIIGQIMAEACYHDATDYIDEVREEYRARRNYMYDRLSNMKDVKCYLPDAAFYNMTELPVDDANIFCQWLLTDFNKDGRTVMMAPADGFYFHRALGQRQVRIAFVLDQLRLKEAMDCLEYGLEQYQGVMKGRTQHSMA